MNQNVSPIRLAVVNLLVLTLLATLVGRLWYVQVLSGSQAQELAQRTSVRFVYEQAPRGFIFDRHGRALARNRTALTVALDVSRVPANQKNQVTRDLAAALGMPVKEVRDIVNDPRIGNYTPRPIARDVNKDIVIYLEEHPERFPGVTHLEIPVRQYPYKAFASHVIGHIGEIDEEELQAEQRARADAKRQGRALHEYRPGDLVGKVGVEKVYEDWLSGTPGVEKIAVDVHGKRVEDFGHEPPQRGWDAVLTLDANAQLAAENALQDGLKTSRRLTDPDSGKKFVAPAGAVVALDPRNGDVLALASDPDFDPNVFVGHTTRAELAKLNAPDSHMPFLDRAVAEAVPPGSTFKPITALAAWTAEPDLANRTFPCPGSIKIGNRTFRNWDKNGQGTLGLSQAIAQSCDIVFYRLGVELDARRRDVGERLQDTARKFGFGRATDIDLLGEQKGLVPDAEWKWQHFSYAQTFDRRWFPGDAANLAIGQGFLQATPLQLASAYGALANGGRIYRPHVLECLAKLDVSQPTQVARACRDGTTPVSARKKLEGRLGLDPRSIAFVVDAMKGTVVGDGTAAPAFSGFPLDGVSVAGKTGTAQMKPKQSFSWFAAIANRNGREMVVVALVEEAGTGAQIAAPIVRKVIESYYGIKSKGFTTGVRAD